MTARPKLSPNAAPEFRLDRLNRHSEQYLTAL
jgi:hypothetical protein